MNNNDIFQGYGGYQNFQNKFNQFAQSFNGDPRSLVQQLIDSGRMSPQQFNQISQVANLMMRSGFFGRF